MKDDLKKYRIAMWVISAGYLLIMIGWIVIGFQARSLRRDIQQTTIEVNATRDKLQGYAPKIEAMNDRLESMIRRVENRADRVSEITGELKSLETRILHVDAGSQGRDSALTEQLKKQQEEYSQAAKILQEQIRSIADYVTEGK